MKKHRIELLDSFRCIAALSVLLYHYTYRWSFLYPYGNFFKNIFSYGYLGVHFFFMISGFVISYTLENTPTLPAFFRNRFSRLFPPMLLCSVLTFLGVLLLDDRHLFPNAHQARNFLPGLTFVAPPIWNFLTGIPFSWLNGSYWSLWTEVQFYLLAAGIYFSGKQHFFRNILVAGVAINILKYVPIYLLHSHKPWLQAHGWDSFFSGWKRGGELFNISYFILWFLSGSIFYHLYKRLPAQQNVFAGTCLAILSFFIIAEARAFSANYFYKVTVAYLVMLALFFLMIYRKQYLSFLDNALVTRIGVISYTLYLIHENLGVLLINKYGKLPGDWSPATPFLVIILMIAFAELSYRSYEKKASLFLKGSGDN